VFAISPHRPTLLCLTTSPDLFAYETARLKWP